MKNDQDPVLGTRHRWSRRRWLIAAGAAVGLCGVLAYAEPMWKYSAPTYTAGDKLSALTLTSQFHQVGDNLNDLNDRLVNLEALVAFLSVPSGTSDCAPGYTKQTDPNFTVCKKGRDEMVKVGAGPSAFWIDRYEASVWERPDGTGGQYGSKTDDYPGNPATKSGQWKRGTQPYALSVTGVPPSAYITWFQAQEVCRASGKRLPMRHEWLAAAAGTDDPGLSDGKDGNCLTGASDPRVTGRGFKCASNWGTEDMIGNVAEWTDEWYAGLGWNGGQGQQEFAKASSWLRPEYNMDLLANIASTARERDIVGKDAKRDGYPAAAIRGGYADSDDPLGTGAGIFALNLNSAPSNWGGAVGFRCVIGGR